MKYVLLLLILFLLHKNSEGQNYVDILKLSASTTPLNTFDSSNSKSKLIQTDADLSIPIKLNERTAVVSGVINESFQTKLFPNGQTMSFGSTTIKLGINHRMNDKWTATMVLLPKIASDYGNYHTGDLQLGGVGIFKFKKSEHVNYKFGLYYNNELFGPFFVPMAGLYYLSPNKKLEANLMLPLTADINYQIIPKVSIGANFNGQIRSYHLTHALPEHSDTYLSRSTNEFYAYLKFTLGKNVVLQTKVGQSIARNFRVYDRNDKVTFGLPATFIGGNRKQLNSDFSDGMIFQATFIFRVATK